MFAVLVYCWVRVPSHSLNNLYIYEPQFNRIQGEGYGNVKFQFCLFLSEGLFFKHRPLFRKSLSPREANRKSQKLSTFEQNGGKTMEMNAYTSVFLVLFFPG